MDQPAAGGHPLRIPGQNLGLHDPGCRSDRFRLRARKSRSRSRDAGACRKRREGTILDQSQKRIRGGEVAAHRLGQQRPDAMLRGHSLSNLGSVDPRDRALESRHIRPLLRSRLCAEISRRAFRLTCQRPAKDQRPNLIWPNSRAAQLIKANSRLWLRCACGAKACACHYIKRKCSFSFKFHEQCAESRFLLFENFPSNVAPGQTDTRPILDAGAGTELKRSAPNFTVEVRRQSKRTSAPNPDPRPFATEPPRSAFDRDLQRVADAAFRGPNLSTASWPRPRLRSRKGEFFPALCGSIPTRLRREESSPGSEPDAIVEDLKVASAAQEEGGGRDGQGASNFRRRRGRCVFPAPAKRQRTDAPNGPASDAAVVAASARKAKNLRVRLRASRKRHFRLKIGRKLCLTSRRPPRSNSSRQRRPTARRVRLERNANARS